MTQQKPESMSVQASPSLGGRKNQGDLKKQSTSPTSKLTTPSNSMPSSPFVARRLKINQSPVPSAVSEVLKIYLLNNYFTLKGLNIFQPIELPKTFVITLFFVHLGTSRPQIPHPSIYSFPTKVL